MVSPFLSLCARTAIALLRFTRFYWKRVCVHLVNVLAGPPQLQWLQAARRALLRIIGLQIGPLCQISEAFYIYDGRKLAIGSGCRVGAFAKIWDFCQITIGDGLLASHNLVLISATHDVSDFSNKPGPITIGRNVWIGANVTIVGPVTIGDDVIIGACSLVTKDIPSNVVAAGSPARVIRQR